MLISAHLAAGLVLGKIFDNYPLAVIGATFLDLDHAISYLKSGLIFRPRELAETLSKREDDYGDQRNLLHNFIAFLLISSLGLIADGHLGLVFALAYLSHLVIDLLDSSDSFPFFPNKHINIKGPIRYFSKEELIFTCALLLIFFLLK